MRWILFITKKFVSVAIYPVGTCLILIVAGLLLWRFSRWRRVGLFLVALGCAWLLIGSLPLTGWLLVHPLEVRAGSYANPSELADRGVRDIVVLGGDLRPGDLTPTDRIAYTTLVRFMEGLRLWRGMPRSRLILSGGTYWGDVMSNAQAMSLVAQELGVPEDRIIIEGLSLDTEDEAVFLKKTLKGGPFALVTSAVHMPRALANFRRVGLDPIPAPADFHTAAFEFGYNMLLPGAHGMVLTEKAIHEYAGLLHLYLKSMIIGTPEPTKPLPVPPHRPGR